MITSKMITPNDNINDITLNVIIFEGQNVIIFKCGGYYHFSGVNVLKAWMLSFSSVEDVIIFHCVNVIIFEVLDVIILSVEDVIIFHGALGILSFCKSQQMLSFLLYNF
jgi:hypothetical protein